MGRPCSIRRLCSPLRGRLPSEDEWEYACSEGADSLFQWGDDLPNDVELERILWVGFKSQVAAASHPFALLGLYFSEWTQSRFTVARGASFAENDLSDWVVTGGGAFFWPWQDAESVWCMPAMRMPGGVLVDGKCAFRGVWDI